MKIERISWDQETADHISKHSVTPEEVEQVLFNELDAPLIMKGREGRYLAYGRTNGDRLLFIVWINRYRRTIIITARDMSNKERQFYKRMKK
jgi:uncharacterized DUF497 family protein